ncbi:hypothetical protein BG262_08625 [Floricoccus penangensis]|uniref:Uncharacterized protein n=1 Tax=Floricoccus penangensis TaxID=1859475 RepID=A0A9Q5JHQ5_9LACT|nr:hypothetical protein BG262_08625 [Floricoccus penangensis]
MKRFPNLEQKYIKNVSAKSLKINKKYAIILKAYLSLFCYTNSIAFEKLVFFYFKKFTDNLLIIENML